VSETSLREKIRLQLGDGTLPKEAPRRVYGGLGIGVRCNICERPVGVAENELQLQFVRDSDSLSIVVFHLHPRCYAAWELERSG
jgi:hypothetical protein